MPGFYFYEKHITSSNCSDTRNAGRALITTDSKFSYCTPSESFAHYIEDMSISNESKKRGVACPTGGSVPDNIAYSSIVPEPSFSFSFTFSSVFFDRIITIKDFTNSWPSYLTYSMPMSYQANGAGNQIPLTSSCSATAGCVLSFPSDIRNATVYAVPNFLAPHSQLQIESFNFQLNLCLVRRASPIQPLNATYLLMISYPQNDCSGLNAPLAVMSAVIDQCYVGGFTRSYKYTYDVDTDKAAVVAYNNEVCQEPGVESISSTHLGQCQLYLLTGTKARFMSFKVSEFPLLPVEGHYFYEKHITYENCSDTTNAGRTLIHASESTCVRAENYDRFINSISQQGAGLLSSYSVSTSCGQTSGITFRGLSCGVEIVPDNIAYSTVVPELVFAPFLSSVSLDSITVKYFTNSWPSYLTYSMPGYSMSYQIDGTGNQIPLTSSCSATAGCTLNFPSAGLNIKLYATPNFYAPPGITPQVTTQTIQLPSPPKVTSINIIKTMHDSITFEYVVNDLSYGSETTYIVKVNGVENNSNASCAVGPSCTIKGLVAGSNVTLSVYAVTRNYASVEFTQNATLYQAITKIELPTLVSRTNSLSLTYNLVGGDKRYPLLSSTTNSVTTVHPPASQPLPQTHNAQTLASISNQNLTVVSLATTSVIVEYSYNGGVPGETTVSFTVNSTAATCTPIQGSSSQCNISSLTPGSTYDIVATISNDGTTVTAQKTFTTYPSVVLSIALEQYNSYFNVSYTTKGGIPGATTYIGVVNGTEMEAHPGYFIYHYENGQYPSRKIFTIVVYATNDGDTDMEILRFTTYVPPGGFSTSQVFGVNSVNMTWTELVGGKPDSTYYQATLDFEGGPNIVKCNTTGFYCYIDNLVPDVEYYYGFYAYNSFFNPHYNNGDSHTYPELNKNCTDDCNGQGQCVIGSCECDQGWDGPSCNIKLSSNTTQSIVLAPTTTNQPTLSISFNNQVKFSIGLLKLVEIDTVNNNTDVRGLDLTTLTGWKSSGNGLYYNASGLSIFIGATQVKQDNAEVYFAGQTYNNTVGSILYNITISGWAFASPNNQFEIHASISNPTICKETLNNSTFSTPNNLTSSLLIGDATVSEALLQGKLVHSSMVDTLPNIITYRSESGGSVNTTTIVAITPTFTRSITIQPSFHLINRNLTQECTTDDSVSLAPISHPSFIIMLILISILLNILI
ncbi:hypothetical protein DFA_06230 [Cavenderia fasciculata]|uniref:Fibronectin type-III domain-containing protein n=1 Tax=Cavenderia fasciculata TaxID=261658 RepID=F4PKG7_CACFS|nr:uncharacterized protein DFA_06230 [Cavenderia fasciculata]EGG24091.1 hypothetical protein DFA_06230 [Cavenderia fasciculata]|eukprot:XP_004361942.1 hypothetical protein DFA_06230 [Cavenderia fasciculata]